MEKFRITILLLFTLLIIPLGTSYSNGFYVLNNYLFSYPSEYENSTYLDIHFEPERFCVRYETTSGWSKNYSVEVRTRTGSELNSATNSFDYKTYTNYAVIFWGENQASVIELRSYFGSYSTYGTRGKDQNGREWELKKTSYCR